MCLVYLNLYLLVFVFVCVGFGFYVCLVGVVVLDF